MKLILFFFLIAFLSGCTIYITELQLQNGDEYINYKHGWGIVPYLHSLTPSPSKIKELQMDGVYVNLDITAQSKIPHNDIEYDIHFDSIQIVTIPDSTRMLFVKCSEMFNSRANFSYTMKSFRFKDSLKLADIFLKEETKEADFTFYVHFQEVRTKLITYDTLTTRFKKIEYSERS